MPAATPESAPQVEKDSKVCRPSAPHRCGIVFRHPRCSSTEDTIPHLWKRALQGNALRSATSTMCSGVPLPQSFKLPGGCTRCKPVLAPYAMLALLLPIEQVKVFASCLVHETGTCCFKSDMSRASWSTIVPSCLIGSLML